jgi:hypothetical protein
LDAKRIKLEDKNKKYVFIGYSLKSKRYNLYDLIEKKLVISIDVELNEETDWDWKNHHEELFTEKINMRLSIRDYEASSLRNSEENSNSGSSDESETELRILRFCDL